LSLAAED